MSRSAAASSGGPAAPPRTGSIYRGGPGIWAWVAHRITGVLAFFWLFVHVLDIALMRVSPQAYDTVVNTYKNPLMNLLEVGLVGAVLFHALNGIRITLVDAWPGGARHQRSMLWTVVVIWVALMVPTAIFMLRFSALALFGTPA